MDCRGRGVRKCYLVPLELIECKKIEGAESTTL